MEPTPEHLDSHRPDAVRRRLDEPAKHSYLRDFIYGSIDGGVTTFAVVSGVAGAKLGIDIVLILGVANLLADGFSMAVSNYLGTRSEEEARQAAQREEQRHIDLHPEGEVEEIRQIFARKGFEGELLEKVVETITSDRNQWVETMLQDELGLAPSPADPKRAALSTFVAFVLIGAIPLLPFVYLSLNPDGLATPYLVSALLTIVAFFGVGAAKARFVKRPWYHSGAETALLGGAAAAIAYLVGYLLKGLGA